MPIIVAILNRMRGAGMPKWLWFAVMFLLPFTIGKDWGFCVAWAVFILGYAVLPWQAMFSAFTGMPFVRKDGRYVQWMQDWSTALSRKYIIGHWSNKSLWKLSGVIYGVFRAIPMMFGVAALYLYTGNTSALWGVLFFGMGLVYLVSGIVCRIIKQRFTVRGSIEVVLAELMMGLLIWGYLWGMRRVTNTEER